MEPKSIEEACAILNGDPAAKILAGGTDLLVNMKHRVEVPSVVVNIKRVSGLDSIEEDNGALRVGALTSLKKIYATPLVREKVPALVQAASSGFRAVNDNGNILDAYRSVAVHRHDCLAKIIQVVDIAKAANHVFRTIEFQGPSTDVEIALHDGLHDLCDIHAAGFHCDGVDIDLVFLDEAANRRDL